jgi:hypothetical protein
MQTPAEAWAKLAELQTAADRLFNPAIPQAEWNKKPEARLEFRRLVEAAVALCKSEGIYEHVMAHIKSETEASHPGSQQTKE